MRRWLQFAVQNCLFDSQVTDPAAKYAKILNATIACALSIKSLGLRFVPLDRNTMHIGILKKEILHLMLTNRQNWGFLWH